MASLRLQFPEAQEPREIALRGARITIGRASDNTIQIIDRTLSAHHAEFVEHGDYYQLRDNASTNGVFVNGERVTDFRLRESCRIGFGTFECEFRANAAAVDAGMESLPTAADVRSLRAENEELRGKMATLQEEVSAFRRTSPAGEGSGAAEGAGADDLRSLIAERAALREAQQASAHEIARLRGELAVAQRDRDNLQRASDAAKAEIDRVWQELVEKEDLPQATVPTSATSTISAPPRSGATVPARGGLPASGATPVPRAVPAPAVARAAANQPTSPGQPRAVPRATPAALQPKPRSTPPP